MESCLLSSTVRTLKFEDVSINNLETDNIVLRRSTMLHIHLEKSLPCGWPVEAGHLRKHGNQHPYPFPGVRLRALPTFSVPVRARRFAIRVSWIRHIYPSLQCIPTRRVGNGVLFHTASYQGGDTVDALLRHISRDDHAAPLASTYIIS